jgi:hypothetical protein
MMSNDDVVAVGMFTLILFTALFVGYMLGAVLTERYDSAADKLARDSIDCEQDVKIASGEELGVDQYVLNAEKLAAENGNELEIGRVESGGVHYVALVFKECR